jgi:hypothetical protein
MAVLIDRPPQIVPFAVDGEKDFIEVPLVPTSGTAMPSLVRVRLPELPAPVAHGFIGKDDAAFCHQLFDIAVAQTKAEVQPDTMADNLRRESMALVEIGGW